MLVQADLNHALPVRPRSFDAILSSLVSEHLSDLGTFFRETFAVLRPGGRLVFAAFHPEPARAGIEANFEHEGTEYRLGAEPYSIDDYLNHIADAGFQDIRWREHAPDSTLARELPPAERYLGRPLLLVVEANRPLPCAA
jgi:SAM-dependent methyltransferase